MIYFNCDYTEGCHPDILKRLTETNMEQTIGYGMDEHCRHAADLIQKACDYLTEQGYEDIYTMELPFHNVEQDGQASEHPSLKTHQKDAKRLVSKIKEIMPELA